MGRACAEPRIDDRGLLLASSVFLIREPEAAPPPPVAVRLRSSLVKNKAGSPSGLRTRNGGVPPLSPLPPHGFGGKCEVRPVKPPPPPSPKKIPAAPARAAPGRSAAADGSEGAVRCAACAAGAAADAGTVTSIGGVRSRSLSFLLTPRRAPAQKKEKKRKGRTAVGRTGAAASLAAGDDGMRAAARAGGGPEMTAP